MIKCQLNVDLVSISILIELIKEGGCFFLIHGHLLITDLYLFEGLILVKNIFLMVTKNFVWLQPQMERFVLVLLECVE